jgi:septin family protein
MQADPDSLKTVLEPMEVAEAGRRLHVSVQDMPGWGDDINLVRYLRVVVDFILQARQKVRYDSVTYTLFVCPCVRSA